MSISTGNGDDGETSISINKRISKNCHIFNVLGTLDELSSFLGVIKISITNKDVYLLLEDVQQNIQYICSNLAGYGVNNIKDMVSDLTITVHDLERKVDVSNEFTLAGGCMVSAQLDFARTICRRAERLTVDYYNMFKFDKYIIAYLNRLSDVLFLLARMER